MDLDEVMRHIEELVESWPTKSGDDKIRTVQLIAKYALMLPNVG